MKKALIIACYIGKLPVNINMWLKSCGCNPDYHFMLVTDDKINIEIPSNVRILRQTLEELKSRFQKLLDFEITLESPYKLCDYKPLYGAAFEEYIDGYEFWGHCDLDMIFGYISDFYTEDILNRYDRIGSFGHLILYRNTPEINNLYRKKGSPFSYKKVFSSEYNYGFDERYGYNMICKYNNIRWLDCGHKYCLDKWYTDPLYFSDVKNFPRQAVLLKEGKIYQIFINEDNKLQLNEKIYFHFSGTKYYLEDLSEQIVFNDDECVSFDGNLEDYLGSKIPVTEKPDFNADRWKEFRKRNMIQKYIYLKQKFYYFILRR